MKVNTQAWVAKAEEDLEAARILLKHTLWDSSCYHSQQAAEKFLKGLLCECDLSIPKIHDLEKLLMLLEEGGRHLEDDLHDHCASLTGMDTLVRYPGYIATEGDANSAIHSSQLIRQGVLANLDALR